MNAGQVIFSLDFELGWGHRESRPAYVDKLRTRGDLVRERITDLIGLFERYDIPATWAVVGKLVKSGNDPMFHAPDLFETLLGSEPDHEIGLHSHGHRFYDQLSRSDAEADLKAGIDTLADWGCRPHSFVFPQNRVSHLDRLAAHDIRRYRTDSNQSRNILSRVTAPATFDFPTKDKQPIAIPSSMFLAARRPSWYRRRYALRGLANAAEKLEIVHYWLHPHNVVTDDSLLDEIETLLAQSRSAADNGNVVINTMSEATATNRSQSFEDEIP
jgi:predicted deacetylase